MRMSHADLRYMKFSMTFSRMIRIMKLWLTVLCVVSMMGCSSSSADKQPKPAPSVPARTTASNRSNPLAKYIELVGIRANEKSAGLLLVQKARTLFVGPDTNQLNVLSQGIELVGIRANEKSAGLLHQQKARTLFVGPDTNQLNVLSQGIGSVGGRGSGWNGRGRLGLFVGRGR